MMTNELNNIIQSEVADFFAGFVEIHTELGGPNSIEEAQTQLSDRLCALLAAHEQEPVAKVVSKFGDPEAFGERELELLVDIQKLPYNTPFFAHPAPVPAVPDEIGIKQAYQYMRSNSLAGCYRDGWNDRAALQSGNSEVIQDFLRVLDEYPEQLVPINRNSAVVRALRNAAVGNSAQPVTVPDGLLLALSNAGIAAPESDDMLFATHEKYVQLLVNWVKERKPFAVPAGYVLVPVEPTPEMIEAYRNALYSGEPIVSSTELYKAMLSAAPKAPDGWIPVSERMPDETQPVIVVSVGGVVQRTVYQFCDGVWTDWYEQYNEVPTDAITHWQPLPDAPKVTP